MYGRAIRNESRIRQIDRKADLLELHRAWPERYPFLLQSTATGSPLGRYDILFALPGDSIELRSDRTLSGERCGSAGEFLCALDDWWRAEAVPASADELPFTGGWFVYLGYGLAGEIEPALDIAADAMLPTAFAVRCRGAVVVDHEHDRCYSVVEADAADAAADIARDVREAGAVRTPRPGLLRAPVTAEEPGERFLDGVIRAKEYISAGDIYQANLSRGWQVRIDASLDPSQVYDALRGANPAPFSGLARWRETTIVSSSPERLLQVRDGVASTRPIAGTRPRSDDADLDDSLSAELFAHPKERAEHVMLIDLERNDLGRVCIPGSVEVDELMVLESYAHVHHIVSNVRGRLRDDVSPGDTIRAVFPGGTITGCPKFRCMEIIAELEHEPRGAYTGSFGYLNRDGSMDLNILIRTMVMQGNTISLRAGSGIVADSEPEAELLETRAKAKGLLQALQP